MSSYTAKLHCEKCGKLLAVVRASHKLGASVLVPQYFYERYYKLPSIFCQECLNRVEENNAT